MHTLTGRAGSSSPILVATGGGDFTITPGLPTLPNLPAGGSISYPVTVSSIGSQSGNVNLALAPPAGGSMPAGVTYSFVPPQVYVSGSGVGPSTLTLYSTAGTPGGAYPLVITGTLGSAQRTAAFSLGTQVTGFQVTSATGSGIVHNTGQEVQVTHSVPAGNAPAYTTCDTADQDVSCRVISASAGTVTLGITASASAVHGTRVLNLNNGAATAHAAVGDVAPTSISVSPSEVTAGQWTQVAVTITGLNPSCGANADCVPEALVTDSQGNGVTWAAFNPAYSMIEIDPPADSAGGTVDVWWAICDDFVDFDEDWGPCLVGPVPIPIPSPPPPPPPPPALSLSGPQGVPLSGTNTFSLSVSSPSTAQTIQLSLSTNSGTTGSAQFQGGGTATTVNVPAGSSVVSIAISGIQVSSSANNITLTAAIQGVPGSAVTALFSVVGVTISMNTSGQPAGDDAGSAEFLKGASALGTGIDQFPTNTSPQSCNVGVEFVGRVSPSNYTGQITLARNFATANPPGELYKGQTQYDPDYFTTSKGHGPGQPDTSPPELLDTDPQSGGSQGKVYDIDVPGIGLASDDIYRFRANFVEYAVLSDSSPPVIASPNFPWWARVSCTQDSAGNLKLSTDVNNDNQAGTGTTPITWNLQ